jgi:cation transport regulator ChaC
MSTQEALRNHLLEALRSAAESGIAKRLANLEVLMSSPNGVSDHADYVATLLAELDHLAIEDGRLHVIESYLERESPTGDEGEHAPVPRGKMTLLA